MTTRNVLITTGAAQIVFADHAGDFSPAGANDLRQGGETDVQLQTASVADAAAVQSTKVDLGDPRPESFDVSGVLELAATPTAGETVDLYWAPSPDPTAGDANPGGVSGADGAYTGSSSNLAASLKQLNFIGSLVVTEVETSEGVQIIAPGIVFFPSQRHGSLVLVDESGAAFHSDDVETHIVLTPSLIPDIQAEA